MKADLLDLARVGSVKRAPLEELRARLAAHSRCPAERIVILPTPEAVELLDLPAGHYEVLGPDAAPVTAYYTEKRVDLRRFEVLLSDQIVQAGLSALTPVARAEIDSGKNEK